MVELLLAAGADPELYVPGDESPLLQAVARGRSDLARLLLNADAAR